jgi:nucleotide-binding universal stress UspA family protein
MGNTLLVAVDGSPPALEGVRWGASLAQSLRAPLVVAYVSGPNAVMPHQQPAAYQRIEEAEAAYAQATLDAAQRVALGEGVERLRTVRLHGGAAEALADLALQEDAWATVVGAKGHNALSRAFLGSTADRLCHICPTSVLVVRPPVANLPAASGPKVKKLLIAVDGSPAAMRAAERGLALAQAVGGTASLVHVTRPLVYPPELGMLPVQEMLDADLAHGANVLQVLQAALKSQLPVHNLLGPPADAIGQLATDGGFDLVLVGNTGRGAVSRVLLGSVADQLLHVCTKPVLLVR